MSTTVQLFVTCIIDTLYPEVGEAVVKVLQRAGLQWSSRRPDLLWATRLNAGMRAQARPIAIHTIQVFGKTQAR